MLYTIDRKIDGNYENSNKYFNVFICNGLL